MKVKAKYEFPVILITLLLFYVLQNIVLRQTALLRIPELLFNCYGCHSNLGSSDNRHFWCIHFVKLETLKKECGPYWHVVRTKFY